MAGKYTTKAGMMAVGGIFAALAVVIMCLGGLIPVATYVCPILCMIILAMIKTLTDNRIAWAWYAAVSILTLLLGPDKEAAVVFIFVGPYTILKQRIDKLPVPLFFKLLYFNLSTLCAYGVLMRLMGLHEIADEFRELGKYGALIMLAVGNGIFLLLDRLLNMRFSGRK